VGFLRLCGMFVRTSSSAGDVVYATYVVVRLHADEEEDG